MPTYAYLQHLRYIPGEILNVIYQYLLDPKSEEYKQYLSCKDDLKPHRGKEIPKKEKE